MIKSSATFLYKIGSYIKLKTSLKLIKLEMKIIGHLNEGFITPYLRSRCS